MDDDKEVETVYFRHVFMVFTLLFRDLIKKKKVEEKFQ